MAKLTRHWRTIKVWINGHFLFNWHNFKFHPLGGNFFFKCNVLCSSLRHRKHLTLFGSQSRPSLTLILFYLLFSCKLCPTFSYSMDSRCQTSLSFTISWSFLKLMSTELVMPSNHLFLCHLFSSCPQSFPVSGSFLVIQLLASGGQSIRTSASASVLPVNIQGWFPLELIGLISLQSKGFSRIFSSTSIQKH